MPKFRRRPNSDSAFPINTLTQDFEMSDKDAEVLAGLESTECSRCGVALLTKDVYATFDDKPLCGPCSDVVERALGGDTSGLTPEEKWQRQVQPSQPSPKSISEHVKFGLSSLGVVSGDTGKFVPKKKAKGAQANEDNYALSTAGDSSILDSEEDKP